MLANLSLYQQSQPLSKGAPVFLRKLLSGGLKFGRNADIDSGVERFVSNRFASHDGLLVDDVVHCKSSIDIMEDVLQNVVINEMEMTMKYHYTYRLTAINPMDERVEYIGVRSCDCLPEEDTGYMSSSRSVKAAINDGVCFTKEIIATWPTRKEAVAHEVALHDARDVARNACYFNKAKQTSTGFDTAGVIISEEHKNKCSLKIKEKWADPEFKNSQIKKIIEFSKSESFLIKVSSAAKRMWSDDEKRKDICKKNKASWNDERRSKKSTYVKLMMANDEWREAWLSKTRQASLLRKGKSMPAFVGENNPFFGKTHTSETKEKISLFAKNRTGEKSPRFGKSFSSESKAKIAKSVKDHHLLYRMYCQSQNICNPGRGYSNIDKADFSKWLAERECA